MREFRLIPVEQDVRPEPSKNALPDTVKARENPEIQDAHPTLIQQE